MRYLLSLLLVCLLCSTTFAIGSKRWTFNNQQRMNVYKYQQPSGVTYYYDYRTYNFPAKGRVRFSDVKRDIQAQRQFRLFFGFGKQR